MPLRHVRYRWKTYPSGKKVRLAFRKGTNRVVEVKSGQTGRTELVKGKKRKASSRTRIRS